MENVNETVRLQAKDVKSKDGQSFTVGQANKLLKTNRSQFELHPDEKNWTWNGMELAKAETKTAKSAKEEATAEKAEK